MTEREPKRISLVTSNPTEDGKIEVVALVNRKDEIFVMPRNVAAALIASIAKALAER
jgi:hypothetical protein